MPDAVRDTIEAAAATATLLNSFTSCLLNEDSTGREGEEREEEGEDGEEEKVGKGCEVDEQEVD